MVNLYLVLATLPLCAQPETAQTETAQPETAQLIDVRRGKTIDVPALAAGLADRDVIFLGEDHDNAAGHRMQLAIVEALFKRRPNLVISLEMFERDTQGVLDDYLRGRIDERTFLARSRPWKRYREFYRPIVEFARRHKLAVIASNLPRRIAREVAVGKQPDPADAPLIPRTTIAPTDDYWQRFAAVMKAHQGAGEPGALRRYYRAQCLKDDAMAESITDYLAQHPPPRPLVVHLCGKFHSDNGQGTALRVLSRRPLLHLGVVSMESTEPDKKLEPCDYHDRCHYLIVTPAEKKRDGDSAKVKKKT